MIPYSRQQVSQADIEAVVSVLKSDFLTQGETVPRFEQAVAQYCNVAYAVASCNATAALHLACLALGVDENSRVWIAATSFVASANCARYCGAEVDFVDCDAKSGLISVAALQKKIERALAQDRLPQVLVVVHLGGQSCDMQSIASLCQRYGIEIIEDACHALGGRYQSQPIGSCQYSACTIFSFHPVKPITTAEGGMLLTARPELAQRARLIANHGIERDRQRFINGGREAGNWYYEQQVLGYNYRLSDIHAALGLSQLARLDELRAQRDALAKNYDALFSAEKFESSNVVPVPQNREGQSAWHLYPVLFPDKAARNQAFDALRAQGFAVNIHYEPIPAQPYYQQLGFSMKEFAGARTYADTSLSLPLHAFVDKQMQANIVELCCL